jgi:hypothetical protein
MPMSIPNTAPVTICSSGCALTRLAVCARSTIVPPAAAPDCRACSICKSQKPISSVCGENSRTSRRLLQVLKARSQLQGIVQLSPGEHCRPFFDELLRGRLRALDGS